MSKLTLKIIDNMLSINRFSPDSKIPDQIYESPLYSITKTDDEISVVCSSSIQLNCETTSTGWLGYKVIGPLDFSLTGILADLSTVLAKAKISIFAISTYDTDYILVKADKLSFASEALRSAGHTIFQD